MSEWRMCEEAEVEAPRAACGCRNCYHARERALDPRLIALTRDPVSKPFVRASNPAQLQVHHILMGYLMGRIDYGLLHIEIIQSLMALADKQNEQLMGLLMRTSPFPQPVISVLQEPPA